MGPAPPSRRELEILLESPGDLVSRLGTPKPLNLTNYPLFTYLLSPHTPDLCGKTCDRWLRGMVARGGASWGKRDLARSRTNASDELQSKLLKGGII